MNQYAMRAEPVGNPARGMTGMVPNLYWTSIPHDRLREDSMYTALPPVEHVHLNDEGSYR